MKPKLKVGDYARDKNGVVFQILNTYVSGGFLRTTDGKWFYQIHKSALCKCTPTFAILPSLPDLEQYRLSLEMYEQLMTELIMHYEYSQNMKSEEIVYAINEDYNTWQTLTEILEA